MDINFILIAITLVFGFYMAFNIGSNDVANAMGTSVGSKALSLKKAVCLAAILEFCGAFFIGAPVSQTIQHGIIDTSILSVDPYIFVVGMLSALITTGIWLQMASHLGLPVSTTHAIVGAVIGFGVSVGGISMVQWHEVSRIFSGWIFSPFISGALSYFLFTIVQKKIFFAKDPIKETTKLFPFFLGSLLFVFFFCLFFEGSFFPLSLLAAITYAFSLAAIGAFATFFIMKQKNSKLDPVYSVVTSAHTVKVGKALKHLKHVEDALHDSWKGEIGPLTKQVENLKAKMDEYSKENPSPFITVEKQFIFLQIVSACLVAFAHGGNDVANAIGPVSAIVQVLNGHALQSSFTISPWLLAFGGAGIVLGLLFLGWKVIETVGTKITELTPTRGFCAEFGAALSILLASKLGLPISTTHALVGAVLGVGLARGMHALNLKTLREIALSWIVTIPLCAIFCSIVFIALKSVITTI